MFDYKRVTWNRTIQLEIDTKIICQNPFLEPFWVPCHIKRLVHQVFHRFQHRDLHVLIIKIWYTTRYADGSIPTIPNWVQYMTIHHTPKIFGCDDMFFSGDSSSKWRFLMGNPHSSPWLFQYQTGRLDDRAKKQNHTGLAMARGIQSKIVLP